MTSETQKYWQISSANPGDNNPIYGNVANIYDWEDWKSYEELFPVRLFINHEFETWREAMPFLEQWPEFIWSDDEVPWVTQKGVDLLFSSQLTGFEMQKILVTGVGNTSIEPASSSKMPSIFRLTVQSESLLSPILRPQSDFFMALINGKRLGISSAAKTWLAEVGWTNFYIEPLQYE